MNHKLHVDVFGKAIGRSGWATHATSFATALNRLTPVRFRTSRRLLLPSLTSNLKIPILRGIGTPPSDFGVVITGEPLQRDRTTRWNVWETTKLPPSQLDLCESTQFLWTPSTWGRQNLIDNGIDPARVAVVPEGVDADFFKPAPKTPGRFRFLMVGKWEARKFPEGLLRAFVEEFSTKEPVELYLHSHNSYVKNFSAKERMERAGIKNEGNIILGAPCSIGALRTLYQSADCFVLPTRAEGWGLPILEAMACGVPAIATHYSAPADYVNDTNGYPLRVEKMVEAHCDDFGIHTGLWAEPDIGHLRHLMRTAFMNRDELIEKGRMARLTAESLTWDNASRVALRFIRQHAS